VLDSFGAYFFSLASQFLHAPSQAVLKRVAVQVKKSGFDAATCSVGLHIRWGASSDKYFYVDHQRPFQSLQKYLRCATQLCPSSRDDPRAAGTVWLLATDSEWVREQIRAAARFLHPGGIF